MPADFAPLPEPKKETPDWKPEPLPIWRKALAALSAAVAVAVFIFSIRTADLSSLVNASGMTSLGGNALRLYAVLIAALAVFMLSIGRRSSPATITQTPKDKRKLAKRTLVAMAMILLLIPLTLFIGVFYLDKKQYYITALLVLLE